MLIPIDQITPDPNQPRKTFDDEAIKELAASFDSHNMISPITVRPYEDGYMIITGEMRYRAAKYKGEQEIVCFIEQATGQQAREMQFIENLQRSELSHEELGEAFSRYCKEHNCSQRELAKRIGKSREYIDEHINIVEKLSSNLCEVATAQPSKPITFTAKRAIATIPDHKRQEELAEYFSDDELTSNDAPKVSEMVRNEPERPVADIVDDYIGYPKKLKRKQKKTEKTLDEILGELVKDAINAFSGISTLMLDKDFDKSTLVKFKAEIIIMQDSIKRFNSVIEGVYD